MLKSQLDFTGKWKNTAIQGSRKEPTIYIFRHAQTEFNRDHIFTGWQDSKLTEFGKSQAEKVAKMLSDKKIDVGIQSSLSRSRDTLEAVLKYHPECKHVFIDDRMIERSYGDYEGTTHAQIIEKYGNRELGEKMLHEIRRLYDFQPPNGESVKMVEGRVLPFIHDLIEFMKKNKVNVAISAHGNSMRPFRRYFEKMNVDQMMKLENPWDNYFEYKIK